MELIYVSDPMCAWCWGFAEAFEQITLRLAKGVELRLVLGGLAADSDEPMPSATRSMVQAAWDAVEQRSGARFNRDFWSRCAPRRSTWPACRAVHAARSLEPGADWRIFRALQEAYYLEARNPSDLQTLVEVAQEQGLDPKAFRAAVASTQVQEAFQRDRKFCERIGMRAFPSLAVRQGGAVAPLTRGWRAFEQIEGDLLARGLIRP